MPAPIPLQVKAMIDEFAGRVRARFGSRLIKIALFGSYARGEAIPMESDVDVLVVIDGLTWREKYEIVNAAAEIGVRENLQLSAMCFTAERWSELERDERLLAKEVARDQVPL